MKVEIKNVKTFEGREGYGFSATVYVDGKKSAVAHDGAYGGPIDTIQIFDEKSWNSFVEKAKEQPKHEEFGMMFDPDWTYIICDLIDEYQFKKSTRKILVEDNGEYFTFKQNYKKEHREQILASLSKNFPNAKLLNGTPTTIEL